jgi:hypothetical protein
MTRHDQHLVANGLIVDVHPNHRVGAQVGGLLLHLGQGVAAPEASSFS